MIDADAWAVSDVVVGIEIVDFRFITADDNAQLARDVATPFRNRARAVHAQVGANAIRVFRIHRWLQDPAWDSLILRFDAHRFSARTICWFAADHHQRGNHDGSQRQRMKEMSSMSNVHVTSGLVVLDWRATSGRAKSGDINNRLFSGNAEQFGDVIIEESADAAGTQTFG